MKCTLRDRRSSLETISGHRADFASYSAAASPGRSISASAPAPVCTLSSQLSETVPDLPMFGDSFTC
jgi:hypothetical protein